MVFHPIARFFAVDPAGAATNVNAWDEVPNSSWFENRLGARPMTPEDVFRGTCGDQVLDPNGPDGSWTIDKGKDNGANPGFRVIEGRFMVIEQAMATPRGREGAHAYLRSFIDEMKASGTVAGALQRSNQPDATVAP